MPVKKQQKPTKQESKAATELQAPEKPKDDPKKNLFKSARRLSDSGIKIDDGTDVGYYHPEDYFPDGMEDGSMSNPFWITNAIQMKGKFGPLVRLTLVEADKSTGWVSLSLGNGDSPIEERVKLVNYFKTNTQAIGPCVFVALPSQYGKPFMSIQEAPDDSIPF
jgi:hypothetical protein